MKTLATITLTAAATVAMAGAAFAEGCFYGHTASKSTPVTAEAPATPVSTPAAVEIVAVDDTATETTAETAEIETAQAEIVSAAQ